MPDFDLAALLPLILFALWAVLLQLTLAFARMRAMIAGKRDITTFKPFGDSDHLDAISRAHMNTVENLPVFAVVYVSALLLHADAPVLAIGWAVFGARMLQSIAHILSRRAGPTRIRATMQFVQVLSFLWLGVTAVLALMAA